MSLSGDGIVGDQVTFDSSNWSGITVTVTAVDDVPRQDPATLPVTTSYVSGDASYSGVTSRVDVTVLNNHTAGAIVTQSNGSMVVSADGTITDTYTVRLTSAPTANVTITPVNDGLTVEAPSALTFTPTNWWIPQTVTVKAVQDPNPALLHPGTKAFAAQPHLLTSLHGPLEIDGGLGSEPPLVIAVVMPLETNRPFLPIAVPPLENTQIDVLNVYDDSSLEDKLGTLTGSSLTGFDLPGGLTFAHTNFGESNSVPGGITYGTVNTDGTTSSNIEVFNLLMGQGNDTLNITSTLHTTALQGGLTVIHGGGSLPVQNAVAGFYTGTIMGNTVIATSPIPDQTGGPTSPLVIFGGTSQDGQWYAGIPYQALGDTISQGSGAQQRFFPRANPFPLRYNGTDVLDASALFANYPGCSSDVGVVIYGGVGNDTIADWLAGGSGNNTIYGDGGNDRIFGSNGINVDVITRALSFPTVNTSTAPDADPLVVGSNTIYSGDSGNKIIIGNLGVITQAPLTQSILTTGNVIEVDNGSDAIGSRVADFGNNTIYGTGALGNDKFTAATGNDVILGGSGANTIWAGNGNDTIIGNDGRVLWTLPTNPDSCVAYPPTLVESTDFAYAGGNVIHGGPGDNIIQGGSGDNTIWAGNGNDLIIGNNGKVTLDGTGVGYSAATLIDTVSYVDPNSGMSAATTHGPGRTVAGTPDVNNVIQAYPVTLSTTPGVGPTPMGGGDDILVGGPGNDWIGGGKGHDLIFGNNVTLTRAPNTDDPRFQTLEGTQIYTDTATTDTLNICAVGRAFRTQDGVVPVWANFTITSLDESDKYTTASMRYGNNYIAGGPNDNMIFGGQGTNTIQGAGSILGALYPPTLTPGAAGVVTLTLTPYTTTYSLTFNGKVIDGISSTATAAMLQSAIGLGGVTVTGTVGGPYTISGLGSATYSVNSKVYAYRDSDIQEQVGPGQSVTALGALHVNPSFEAATDGNNYIEGGGGYGTVIFGGTGQNDIIGGNSDMFSLTTPAQRPDSGNVMIFAGAGTEIGRNDSQSTATVTATAATQNDVLSLTISWVSPTDGSSKSAPVTTRSEQTTPLPIWWQACSLLRRTIRP
jgi:Ca2+-binding RTX toxin-like protein